MKKTWIVLANSARARVLEREAGSGRMVELLDLVHPQSREKADALTSDQEGHAQKAHGDPGRSGTAFQPHTTPHRKELAAFAAEISRHLEVAATTGKFADVALIASDPFLGELKSHLGSATRRALTATVAHDFTSFSGADLGHRVTEALSNPHEA
jgi:protein required for attachment to host cells